MIQPRKYRAGLALAFALSTAAHVPAIAGSSDAAVSARDALFARYPEAGAYHGPVRFPDFRGRDRAFADFRTRIREGAREGVNFAGHYAIIEWGCGTECRGYVIDDVATGKVYNFSLGDGEYRQLSLDYRPTSRLIVAEWLSDADDSSPDDPVQNCFRQNLVWNGSTAVPLSGAAVTGTVKNAGLQGCNKP